MNILFTLITSFAVATSISVTALDSDSGANAALRYWAAWDESWRAEFRTHRNEIRRAAETADEDGFDPSPAVFDALERQRGSLRVIGRASRLSRCDWGLERELGPELLLPHISLLRQSADMLAIEARRTLDAGDTVAAAHWIAAGIRFAAHAGADGSMLETLVAFECFRSVDAVAQRMARLGLLDAEGRALWREALGRIGHDDPFGMRASITREGEAMSAWVAAMGATPEGKSRFFEILGRIVSMSGRAAFDGNRIRMSARIEQAGGWVAAADGISKAYEALLDAWDGEDPEEGFRSVVRRLDEGEFGPVAPVLVPSVTRLWQKASEAHQTVNAARVRAAGS